MDKQESTTSGISTDKSLSEFQADDAAKVK